MIMPGSEPFLNHSVFGPPAWRPRSDTADTRSVSLAQQQEQELFDQIMAEARREDSLLDELFRDATRLAFPQADEAYIDRALARARTDMLRWRESVDQEGNPSWITLTLPERPMEDDGIQPGAVLPSDTESAVPLSEKEAADKKKEQELQGLFGRLLGFFSGDSETKHPPVTRASIAAGKGTIPPPVRRPMRSLFRTFLLSMIFGIFYYALSLRGCVPKIF